MLADRPQDPSLAPVRDLPIIAHVGGRWDPTWHRPHRLLRALAAQAPVLVVEEPVVLDDVRRERLDLLEVAAGVWRALPRLPAYLREEERAAATVRAALQAAIGTTGPLRGRFTGGVHWFSHATGAREFAGQLGEVGIVYDCLAPQRGAARDAAPGARERELLAQADLVVGAGPTVDALAPLHPHVLDVGDGVDLALWSDDRGTVPADLAALSRPLLGYLGPVDDRLDHAILRALRAAAPHGSVVLLGPPGFPPADGSLAPRLPEGVHWLGARDESQLPAYVRAFDACIFPLVPGHAALAADVPMVLECLAAGRPVVTSARPALATPLAAGVHVATDPRAFAAAALAAATTHRRAAVTRDELQAAAATWTQVTHRLRGALFEAIAARPTPMSAIADALIAGRGIPGEARDAR